MIAGLDSSFDAPSAADADAARAAGVRLWNGYLATRANVGLAAPWPELAFVNARRCGGTPIAFCSGWDDPVAVRAQAAAWNVRACLDDEPGIRGDGYDRQAWCDAAGAGIYGLRAVHGVRAAFHVIARYPGFDPGSSWDGTRPADGAPCGWQWQGTHTEFGRSVDRGWFDDWFGGGDMLTPEDKAWLAANVFTAGDRSQLDGLWRGWFTDDGKLSSLLANVSAAQTAILAAIPTGGSALTAPQAQQLADALAALQRIETALKGA